VRGYDCRPGAAPVENASAELALQGRNLDSTANWALDWAPMSLFPVEAKSPIHAFMPALL